MISPLAVSSVLDDGPHELLTKKEYRKRGGMAGDISTCVRSKLDDRPLSFVAKLG